MAYDATNKRVYRDVTATPKLGVGIGDVQTALGVSSGDLGTLCRSSRINPLTKYKPVTAQLLAETGKTSGSDYWKGADGQCGLVIPRDAYNNRVTFARGNVAWSGATVSAPYRLLDFDGYDASGKVTLSSATTIPTGRLTEEGQSSIGFDYGVPVFHVDLNSQDSTGYFLTVNDIRLYYSSTQIPLTDMVLRLFVVSSDGTLSFELPGGEWKADPSSHDEDQLVEKTLGEIRSSGTTRVTFSPLYTFLVSGVSTNPKAGDIYTINGSEFMIQEVVLDGTTLKASSLVCVRKSGTASVPTASYLVRSSGSGDPSIAYTSYEVESYTLGGRTFYVFPFLYAPSYGVICGLGRATPQIALASVTNRIDIQHGAIQWSKVSETVSFLVPGSVANGINASKTVTLKIYTANSANYGNLPDREVEHTRTVTVAALATQAFSFTETTDYNTYTSVRADYEYVDGEGHTVSGVLFGEIIYDENGNVFDPLNQ